jgi:hypothetical protein
MTLAAICCFAHLLLEAPFRLDIAICGSLIIDEKGEEVSDSENRISITGKDGIAGVVATGSAPLLPNNHDAR